MDAWRVRSQRVTTVLLIASLALIAPALAGVGGSVVLAVALVVVGGLLYPLRDRIEELPTVVGYDLGSYLRDSWLGPLVAALVVTANLSGSPAEMQALGGLLGLVGMINYFVRPLYLSVFGFLRTRLRRN